METRDTERTEVATGEGVVAAFLAALVGGDTGSMTDLVTEDTVLHQPRWPLDAEGREAVVGKTRTAEGTFTDVAVEIEQSVRSGDRTATHVTASARNVGPLRMEDREIVPTGRSFSGRSSVSTGSKTERSPRRGYSQTRSGSASNSTTSRKGRGNWWTSASGNSAGARRSTATRLTAEPGPVPDPDDGDRFASTLQRRL